MKDASFSFSWTVYGGATVLYDKVALHSEFLPSGQQVSARSSLFSAAI